MQNEVDITIGSNMYGRIADINNTPSHVLAEFIDNSLQSYLDNKDKLKALEPDYKLIIHINVDWDESTGRMKTLNITDNAAGLNYDKFLSAFQLARTPDNNKGLNEYGMGMKTAALWLGEEWNLETSSINENIARKVVFNLNDVMGNDLANLPIENSYSSLSEHYTQITIKNPTKNALNIKNRHKIAGELSSIYRKYLRNDEVDIYFDNEKLEYQDPAVLVAPYFKTPDGPAVSWKKEIDFKFLSYRAKGYIAVLKDMSDTKSGIALLRRGRVIVGGDLEHPKTLCGNVGSPRYKRLFGELELEGFSVAFNKNGIQDKDNLDALIDALKDEINQPELNIYAQAEGYRLDEKAKAVKKIIHKHDFAKKKGYVIEITLPDPKVTSAEMPKETPKDIPIVEPKPQPVEKMEDKFKINGETYTLRLQFINEGRDFIWLDSTTEKENKILICNVNLSHVFFENFPKPDVQAVAVLKALAIAKFTAQEAGNGMADDMFNYFNMYIKKIKI